MHDVIAISEVPVLVVEHALAASNLAVLRAHGTTPDAFRSAMHQIAALLFVEASRKWETSRVAIETPLAKTEGAIITRPVAFVPILRAGLGLLDPMLQMYPAASIGHIGLYRDEETLRPVSYFNRLPVEVSEAHVVLLDPMLATGNSACEAVSLLKAQGASRIQFLCVVACPDGIRALQLAHPAVQIITAAIDPELNSLGYIVPGLGDAGDRYFGTG